MIGTISNIFTRNWATTIAVISIITFHLRLLCSITVPSMVFQSENTSGRFTVSTACFTLWNKPDALNCSENAVLIAKMIVPWRKIISHRVT